MDSFSKVGGINQFAVSGSFIPVSGTIFYLLPGPFFCCPYFHPLFQVGEIPNFFSPVSG